MASDASYETRYAHTHILGGSGHGKTQILQTLIHRDLTAAGSFLPSVVVIDSQGDLINTISHLKAFDPALEDSLADRLLLIDPTDIEYPPAINLFDANLDRIQKYGAVEQERIMNGTIELYEYFFGALLGAGLSQKQNLIFRYLAQLMLIIPGANIHTLRDLLETPDAFHDDIAKLDGTARMFFERQFFDKSFDDTRTQVSRRLWGILANRSFERIFSSRTSRIDLFEAMNDGKIILINTSKDLLKQEGAAIFGRFFIAMIAQAALERAQIPRDQRRPTFVYIDEAQDYFDENIDYMLEQVRKYKIGLLLAHQTLAQLSPKLKASIMANTGTKLAGGMSHSDATAMAKEFGCTTDFLQSMRKSKTTTSFALWIKNQTPQPREVTVQLGAVDVLEKIDAESYQQLLAANRERYCLPAEALVFEAAPIADVSPATEDLETEQPYEVPEPVQAEPPTDDAEIVLPDIIQPGEPSQPIEPITLEQEDEKEPGHGGPQHTKIQNLIRRAGQERGYLATIEAPTANSNGRIDVLLEREGVRIACEVSSTTKPAHEVGNIQKCLGEEVDHIVLVATSGKQLQAVRSLCQQRPELVDAELLFASPQELLDFLDQLDAERASETTSNRGYKVNVQRQASRQQDQQEQRKQISEKLAQAITK